MKVDSLIERYQSDPDLGPLIALMEKGRGLSVIDFCKFLNFEPKISSAAELAKWLQTAREVKTQKGLTVPWANPVLSKASLSVLRGALKSLGGGSASSKADAERNIRNYIETGELPKPPTKKVSAKRKKPVDAKDKIAAFREIRENVRNLSVGEIESKVDNLCSQRGVTVAVLEQILESNNLRAKGTKSEMIARLLKPLVELRSDIAQANF